MPDNEAPILLSETEFAEAVGMTPRWVRRRRAAGDIDSKKLGKFVRIPKSEVTRILSEGTTPSPETKK